MNKQERKLWTKEFNKNWWEANKGKVVRLGYYAIGAVLGYGVGSWLTQYSLSIGMEKAMAAGIMKLFDPSTGAEIGFEKAAELVLKLKTK